MADTCKAVREDMGREIEALKGEIAALKDELALMREARYEAQRAAPKAPRAAWVDPQAEQRTAYRAFVAENRKPGAVIPGFHAWVAQQAA